LTDDRGLASQYLRLRTSAGTPFPD